MLSEYHFSQMSFPLVGNLSYNYAMKKDFGQAEMTKHRVLQMAKLLRFEKFFETDCSLASQVSGKSLEGAIPATITGSPLIHGM